MKFQLNYQVKNFDQCDSLMSEMVFFDPIAIAMAMTRSFEKDKTSFDDLTGKDLEKALKGWVVTSFYKKAWRV